MYTEYNSQNVYQNSDNYVSDEKPNKFLSILWKILLVIIVLVVLFLLLIKFGVISLTSSIAPDAVILNLNEVGIKKGSGYQLISTVLPENANNKQVIWTSSDPSVVKVNEVTGYIDALKVGSAVVTVKTLINDKTSECLITVTDKNVLVKNINANEKYVSLAVGYTHNLTYRTSPTNATELNIKFTSSDPSVATVDSKGNVRGVKEGNAVINISSNNGSIKDTTYVTVYKKGATTVVNGESVKTDIYPKSIDILDESLNLSLGTTSQLIATISPENSRQDISWSSSNSSIVSVDSNGLLTAKGVGTATIVAKTINNLMDTCTITVGNYSLKLQKIDITTEYTTLPVGVKKQLVVAFTPNNASNKSLTWSSSNSKVVTVDASGNIKAISPGTASITAKSKDGGYTDTVTVEVPNYSNVVEPKNITLSVSKNSIGVNQSITLNPIVTPDTATFKAVSFTTSDSSIARVDINGVVTGLKPGEVIITATMNRNNQIKASVKLNIINIPATGVSLNNTNVKLNSNETYTLTFDVKPNSASDKTVVFKSDNTNVARVDQNGIITAVSKGTAIITITPNGGGNSSTCLVTVN